MPTGFGTFGPAGGVFQVMRQFAGFHEKIGINSRDSPWSRVSDRASQGSVPARFSWFIVPHCRAG